MKWQSGMVYAEEKCTFTSMRVEPERQAALTIFEPQIEHMLVSPSSDVKRGGEPLFRIFTTRFWLTSIDSSRVVSGSGSLVQLSDTDVCCRPVEITDH